MTASRRSKDSIAVRNKPECISADNIHQSAMEWLRERWGWMVTAASFVLYFITLGVLYCYGLLFISLQEDFNSTATITGWIGSLAWAASTLTSPLTALLLRCCQTRVVALLGIVFCSASLLISSFVPNLYYLFFTFSVMYGMGINFTQHSSLCLIYNYFPNKNSTRTISIALTGCQVGMLALNPLMAFLISTMGWRSALRIFSAIVLMPGVVSCATLVPPRRDVQNTEMGDAKTGERLALHQMCNAKGDCCEVRTPVEDDCIEQLNKPNGDTAPMLQSNCKSAACKAGMCQYCIKTTDAFNGNDDSTDDNQNGNMSSSEIKMSQSPDTYFFSFALAMLSLAWTFYHVNLVSYTDSVGITANHGSIILTILAAAEMVGKALLSIFGDHIPCAKVYGIIVCNILSAAISSVMIFATNFYTMICVAVGIGLLRAVFNTLPLGAGIEIFGTSRVTESSTITLFSYGSGYLLGSVIPGSIYDLTGSYTLSLVSTASVFILSATLFLVIPLRKRFKSSTINSCLSWGKKEKQGNSPCKMAAKSSTLWPKNKQCNSSHVVMTSVEYLEC